MAEVLGLVASVVTLGEVATKLVKLRTFWKSIQNIPQSIQTLLEELEALSALITEIEAEQDGLQDTPSGALSLRYCKNAAKELEDLIQKLERQTKSQGRLRRSATKIKLVLDPDSVSNAQKQLYRALQLLQFALALHTRSMTARIPERTASIFLERRNELTLGTVSNTEDSLCGVNTKIERANFSSILEKQTFEWLLGSALGAVRVSRSSHSIQKHDGLVDKVQIAKARCRFPSWLSQTVWDILACRSTHGMTWKISSWNVRPDDSSIFDAAVYGEFKTIVKLVSDGEASFHDRDEHGSTILHYATVNGRFQLATKLLTLAPYVLEKDANNDWPVPYPRWYGEVPAPASSLEYIKALMRHEVFIDCLDNFAPLRLTRQLGACIWAVPGFLTFLENETQQKFSQFPLSIQFSWFEWDNVNVDVLKYVLSENCFTIKNLKECLDLVGFQSLHYFIWAYVSRQIEQEFGSFLPKKSEAWQELAQAMLSGISVSQLVQSSEIIVFRGLTPLAFTFIFILRNMGHLSPRWIRQRVNNLTVVVRFFLQDVSEAGINLEEYGRRESELLMSCFTHPRHWRTPELTRSNPYLVSIKYGPRPEDWDLICDLLVEEFAGEFWEMLENQHPRIPGAWVDDE